MNRRELSVKLISSGTIDSNLHFGPFAQDWWFESTIQNSIGSKPLIPIRVGMRTQVELNNRNFILHVVQGNLNNSCQPGYICESGNDTSKIETTATQAISSLYQSIFNTRTRYSGTLVMGLENIDIINQLLVDVEFQPFSIKVDSYNVLVFSVGISLQKDWLGAGSGYMSSFVHVYRKKRCVFFQKFLEEFCIIEGFDGTEKVCEFKGSTPSEAWKNSGILSKMDGSALFGLEHPATIEMLKNHQIPKCQLKDWNDESIMDKLYKYHLQRRTITNINWYSLFVRWFNQTNNILELRTSLSKIYPSNHQFSDRELQAWHSFLKAEGCTNITPFKSDVSMVCFNFIYCCIIIFYICF